MAASPPVVGALDTGEVVPVASVAGGASSPALAAVPVGPAAVSGDSTASRTAAVPRSPSTPSLRENRGADAQHAYAAPAATLVGSRVDLAAPASDRAQASGQRTAASAPAPRSVPAGIGWCGQRRCRGGGVRRLRSRVVAVPCRVGVARRLLLSCDRTSGPAAAGALHLRSRAPGLNRVAVLSPSAGVCAGRFTLDFLEMRCIGDGPWQRSP